MLSNNIIIFSVINISKLENKFKIKTGLKYVYSYI